MPINYSSDDNQVKYYVACDRMGNTVVIRCDPRTGELCEVEGKFDNLLDARNYVEYQQGKQFKAVYK